MTGVTAWLEKHDRRGTWQLDPWFLSCVVMLLALGLVMVASASLAIAERQLGQPFYYLLRQSCYVGLGLLVAMIVLRIDIRYWQNISMLLLGLSVVLLLLVLIPGVGHQVNGSMRWLTIGPLTAQPSELVKLLVIIYLAGYLVRRGDEVRTAFFGFVKPVLLLMLLSALLLIEPDFGAVAIMLVTAMVMMFLAGVQLRQFVLLLMSSTAIGLLLAYSAPYRVARMTTFMDPWADPFASGFQLTQALIAFGRGEWLGVGLGSSIQKLFYLPEAHTDFMFAVLAEELGLLAAVLVIIAFVVLVYRSFVIGRRAERSGDQFAGYICYGIGAWIGLQAFTNIGVNMGALPTKGLTLPLMSYGGSSLVVMLIAVALVLRVDYEVRLSHGERRRRQRAW